MATQREQGIMIILLVLLYSAARTRYVHGGRGEDRQQCEDLLIKEGDDKRRRWMGLGLEYSDYCMCTCIRDGL